MVLFLRPVASKKQHLDGIEEFGCVLDLGFDYYCLLDGCCRLGLNMVVGCGGGFGLLPID